MNSVHEPGPNGDSETLPSRKTRSKTKPGARAPKLAQLARPGAHWRAARMAARRRSYRGRVPVVSWPETGCIVGASAPCRGLCACSCARCAARLAAQAHCIVIQLPSRLATLVTIHYVYCDTTANLQACLSHNTHECIAIQSFLTIHFLQYKAS